MKINEGKGRISKTVTEAKVSFSEVLKWGLGRMIN
jgi:hypothetical protein